jgi:branched-chain amino acid transport system permease protein
MADPTPGTTPARGTTDGDGAAGSTDVEHRPADGEQAGGTPPPGSTAAAAPSVSERLQLPPVLLWTRVVFGVVLAAIALYLPFSFAPEYNRLLSQALYLAIAAMGLNLLTGFNGQVSIGHGAFFGVGAFTTAILMRGFEFADGAFYTNGAPPDADVLLTVNPLSFEATIPVAMVLTGVIGLLVGFPALRVRGIYLALVTLGLAVLLPSVLNQYVKGTGNTPLVQPDRSDFGSLFTFLEDDQYAYFFCLVAMVVVFVGARNLVNTRMGRAMVACRDQELAATTLGVNLARVKVGTFAISAAYAGLAGSLSVMVDGQAVGNNPGLYFQRSIEFLVAMVIGGTTTILGPLVGAGILVALRHNTEGLIEDKPILSPALFGAGLILIVYVLPDGVVGAVRRVVMVSLLRRQSRAHGSSPPVREPTEETSR